MMKQKRIDFLKMMARSGAAAGLLGICGVLVAREEKFECTNRCGRCEKNVQGQCALGLR